MRTDDSAADRARRLSARGRAVEAEGDFGEAVSALLDAAAAFKAAGDEDEARACAERVLDLWPRFEESKSLIMRPAKPPETAAQRTKRLRRLPKAAGRARGSADAEEPGELAPPVTALPSMFIEMHAQALRLAGREREARKRFEEALSAVESEVGRRRKAQEWSEAFSAAQGLLRVVKQLGGEGRLADARRAFIAVAREAAHEALTAEYFARGKDALPEEAMQAAVKEARALKDESLLRELGADAREVLAQSADLLDALSSERTAAEAILAWEDSWAFLTARPELKRAVLDRPGLAASLTGPLAILGGLAENHPARAELKEFHETLQEVLGRARERAGALRARGAAARPS